ncbi:uncharacterized protein BJ171DRAFT_127366 [Polychytrium aggregatum]|uniref:uncharacterized protein n=1 Tax=Polychytrium aggregatum TaxID=110093 RepID=UPI0022FF1659|nr:uncharacterized protein BJ171DRAFT_127366 [Polychytrium aggregatum]KAI9204013.1 hypothetical protein BJ171DRAFT_127366 [Polychytrium aggregatum]
MGSRARLPSFADLDSSISFHRRQRLHSASASESSSPYHYPLVSSAPRLSSAPRSYDRSYDIASRRPLVMTAPLYPHSASDRSSQSLGGRLSTPGTSEGRYNPSPPGSIRNFEYASGASHQPLAPSMPVEPPRAPASSLSAYGEAATPSKKSHPSDPASYPPSLSAPSPAPQPQPQSYPTPSPVSQPGRPGYHISSQSNPRTEAGPASAWSHGDLLPSGRPLSDPGVGPSSLSQAMSIRQQPELLPHQAYSLDRSVSSHSRQPNIHSADPKDLSWTDARLHPNRHQADDHRPMMGQPAHHSGAPDQPMAHHHPIHHPVHHPLPHHLAPQHHPHHHPQQPQQLQQPQPSYPPPQQHSLVHHRAALHYPQHNPQLSSAAPSHPDVYPGGYDAHLAYPPLVADEPSQHAADYPSLDNRKKRRRVNPEQLAILSATFERTHFPSTNERLELARRCDMTPRAVQIWFQNRRQGWKARNRNAAQENASKPTDSKDPAASTTIYPETSSPHSTDCINSNASDSPQPVP